MNYAFQLLFFQDAVNIHQMHEFFLTWQQQHRISAELNSLHMSRLFFINGNRMHVDIRIVMRKHAMMTV